MLPEKEGIYRANLEALKARYGTPFLKSLENSGNTPVGIDPNVDISNLKNPIYTCVVGFSTAGFIRKLIDKKEKEVHYICAIEPDLSKFHALLKREYIGDLLHNKKIDFIIGEDVDTLPSLLYKIFSHVDKAVGMRAARSQNPTVIVDPFSFPPESPSAKEMSAKIGQYITEASRQVFLSMGCGSDTFFRWDNMFRNKENMQSSYKINPYFGKFEDTPTIIVGGGPSIDGFIKAYHKHDLGQKALIISCEAGLPKLLKEKVKPHIVLRCERKLTHILEGVTKEDTKGIYFAAYPWVDPHFFTLFDKSFALFRTNGVCDWSPWNHGAVNGGVSSANCSLELGYNMGANNIILAGVDLCFIDGKSHSDGTQVEFNIEKSKHKWHQVPGNDGNAVTTIPVWYRCLNEYQNSILKYKNERDVNVFNTSTKGARILHTEVKAWDELAHLFIEKRDVCGVLEKHLEKHDPKCLEEWDTRRLETLSCFKEAKQDLEKLFLNVKHTCIAANREEYKVMEQLRAHNNPREFFKNAYDCSKSMKKVYEDACIAIDEFKSKWFKKSDFTNILIDICQLDYFECENKISSLRNIQPVEYQRFRQYTDLHMGFFRTVNFYLRKMIDLFKSGCHEYVSESDMQGWDTENDYSRAMPKS